MIKAFVVLKDVSPDLARKCVGHLAGIAERFGKYLCSFKSDRFELVVVSDEAEPCFDHRGNGQFDFCLGRIPGHPAEWDRFLKVKLTSDHLELETDYAGSIPLFYSSRNGFVASNIEPCVFLGSGSTLNDLSPENVYGFMRFTHFIWDETAWRHISQTLPDSRYIFNWENTNPNIEHLKTIHFSEERREMDDRDVAKDLFDLNQEVVTRSLRDAAQIVLPLSSGYDSRMILAALASNRNLAEKTICFTYGSKGSIEVESGKRLAKIAGIEWHHIDLPCMFLEEKCLKSISDVFGASVHMHGMYQLEFLDQIYKGFGVGKSAVFTSGFMTGVPAGQHNSLLNIVDKNDILCNAMGKFGQSKFWTSTDLADLPIFSSGSYTDLAEDRFRKAFDRIEGDINKRAVIFDVWTRQRNFISYYPRTIEWLNPIASPHMCSEYANFFMSLGDRHLNDRKAVELMFKYHYPKFAGVASNSNGISSIGNSFENIMLLGARILNRMRLGGILPNRYKLAPFEFNLTALRHCGKASFSPIWEVTENISKFVTLFGGVERFDNLYEKALSGDLMAYAKVLTIQSLASDVLHLDNN